MLNLITSMFRSSTGEGIMLRLKSFLILAVPYVLTFINNQTNSSIAPQGVIEWVNSFFVVVFGIIHAYAWFRSFKTQ